MQMVKGFTPKSYSELGRVLREIGREDLRAICSNVVKMLRDGVRHALSKIERVIEDLEKEVARIKHS